MKELTVYLNFSKTKKKLVGKIAEYKRQIFFEYAASFLSDPLWLSPYKLPIKPGLHKHKDTDFGPIFGLFDDSFMHSTHGGYNTTCWNFFDRDRYQISPAGGEFSYYSNFDQANVLNPDVGAYGVPYEIFAQNCSIRQFFPFLIRKSFALTHFVS